MKNSFKISAIAIACSVIMPLSTLGWSQKGHDVTAFIAQQHLTPATTAAVDSILEGRSLVYWSNWLDNASHNEPYAFTKTWHYINIDEGKTYDNAPRLATGDVVTAMRMTIKTLTDPEAPLADKQLALKILDHITGDLHQPLHAGHASDYGGNTVQVKFFNQEKNLHAVWDSNLPSAAHSWSYSEWQDQIDRATPAEQTVIISGNIDDWAKQSVALAADIYKTFPKGKNISYNQIAEWTPVIEEQFLKGGLRLAHLLNLIFDPTYNAGTLISDPTQL